MKLLACCEDGGKIGIFSTTPSIQNLSISLKVEAGRKDGSNVHIISHMMSTVYTQVVDKSVNWRGCNFV